MQAQYTINSKSELRRAIVTCSDEGVVVNHYRRTSHQTKWVLERVCHPKAPFHVVLDDVTRIINAPPSTGGTMKV